MRIAFGLLPKTALIDTGVLLRFLGDRLDEPKTAACRAFCQAMLDRHHELFIAAPTITEITRWKGSTLPRARGITVVAFDDRAAELLGVRGPESAITRVVQETGAPRNYIRYDFLIAACAARAHADVVVSLDKDLPKICSHLGIACKRPEDYEDRSFVTLVSPLSPTVDS